MIQKIGLLSGLMLSGLVYTAPTKSLVERNVKGYTASYPLRTTQSIAHDLAQARKDYRAFAYAYPKEHPLHAEHQAYIAALELLLKKS